MTFFLLGFFFMFMFSSILNTINRRSQMMRNRWRVWDVSSWDYIVECFIQQVLFIHERQSRHLSAGFSSVWKIFMFFFRMCFVIAQCTRKTMCVFSFAFYFSFLEKHDDILLIFSLCVLFLNMNITPWKWKYSLCVHARSRISRVFYLLAFTFSENNMRI